jgi:hypothetical protein
MPTAKELHRIYSIKLIRAAPYIRDAIEGLLKRLEALPSDDDIRIDVDEGSDITARFVRTSTGETIGELYFPELPDPP